jgi:hypothetical protein
MDVNQLAANVRQVLAQQKGQMDALTEEIRKLKNGMSPESLIDMIPGRRVMFNFTQTQTFTTSSAQQRGNALSYSVSTDGPFIMTHYPVALWKPTLPINATNYYRWRPVGSAPLPTQAVTTDYIDISYEMSDNGSGRNFQDNPASVAMMSYPGQMVPTPKPFVFLPNTVISVVVTYEAITFSGGTAPTQGTLAFTLPGYRIVTALGNGF